MCFEAEKINQDRNYHQQNSKGIPPMPPSPRNEALLREVDPLDVHDKKNQLQWSNAS